MEWERMDKPLRDLIEIIRFAENVSAKIHGLLDEAEVYRAVGEEFAKSKRYTASILLLTDDGSKLRIAETSLPSGKLKAGEKAAGLRLKGYKIDLNKSSIYSQVIREGKTLQVNISDVIDELFPRPLAHLISKTMGYEKTPCILTPLKRHGEIIGAFAISCTDLAEHFIPSVRNLAQHISTALEVADEYAERKRVEEALRESEERYRTLYESSRDGIVAANQDRCITECNQAYAEILGYSREELKGVRDQEITPSKWHAFDEDVFRKEVMERGYSYEFEKEYIRKDGTVVPVSLRTWRIDDGAGNPIGVCSIVRDIAERKGAEEALRRAHDELEIRVQERTAELARANEALRAEIAERKQVGEALRESEERLRSIFNNAAVGIALVDMNGGFTEFNDTWCGMLGYSREELLNLSIRDITPVGETMVLPSESQGGDKYPRVEKRYLRKDGSEFWGDLCATVIHDQYGNASGMIGIIMDITEHKRAEEALERRAEQLAALSQASQVVTASLELDQVLAEIVSLTSKVVAADYTSVVLVDEAGHLSESAENVPGVPAIEYRIRDEGLTNWIVRLRQAVLIDEIGEDGTVTPDLGEGAPRFANPPIVEAGVKSLAGLPLMAKDCLLGVLYLHSLRAGAFQGQLPLLTAFANQAAIAVENARLYQAAQRELVERKQVVEALRESEERYRRLVEFSPETIAVHSEGKIIYINAAGAKLLGAASPEELIGKPIMDFVHPDYQEVKERVWQSYGQRKAAPPLEERYVRPDGQVIDVETAAVPITYQGKPAMLVVARDITERKRAEEELGESERRYRELFESIGDAVMVYSLQERFLDCNEATLQRLGYSREEFLPLGIADIVHPDFHLVMRDNMKRIWAGETTVVESLHRCKDGRVIPVEVSARRIEYQEESAILAVVRDITERKQLEAQLRQAQKMEAIGSLAAGIAHDFNNLLTPISGFAELLLQKAPEGSQQQGYLRHIRVAAERAAALTRQLRLFTRQEEGKRHPIQLNSAVKETRDLLEHSIPKGITIELRLASELWAVEADPSQISQVLMNLCVNACDAMPDGGTLILETRNVTLDEEYARTVLEAQPGRYVCLSVSDTGSGMSPEVQARLFEPFFTTKEMGKGTGLGLSVVYGIVKGHDGFINVYSQMGRGSTFHVYLPAIELAVKEREIEGLQLPTGTETLLLVDDEEMVRALGQRVLELCGYTVLMAEDGVQALEVYQAHQGEIDLVVLDVVMPQMSGQECLRRLRELDPRVKVLMSTGYTARGLAQELLAEGALGVVEKPFLLQDFATAVRGVLDER